jgi:hypothetical protein
MMPYPSMNLPIDICLYCPATLCPMYLASEVNEKKQRSI